MRRSLVGAPLSLLLALSTGCGGGNGSNPASTPTTVTSTATAVARTPTAAATAPASPAATATVPPPTPSAAPSQTPIAVATDTDTLTPTPTATPVPPEVSYLGVARADDLIQTTDLVDDAGRPIFPRVQGQGMSLILEARRGAAPLAGTAFDPTGGLPGAQFLVSRPLGDGSPAVCDFAPPLIGGVPGIDPPVFSNDPVVIDAINDLGCRVNDGTGQALGRFSSNACTRIDPTYEFQFAAPDSELQFCLPIAKAYSFPPGDTIVAARVRDVLGNVSAPREIVVRVQGNAEFECQNGLGERDFTIARPGSALLTSAAAGDVSTDPWLEGPLRICAGPDLGAGVHALTLRQDAILGLALTDGTTLCARLSSRGSDGSLDCDGGTAQDVLASQDDNANASVNVDTGLGLPAGSGAASLRVPIAFAQLQAGSTPADCATANYSAGFEAALTTATGTAQIVDQSGQPTVSLSASGQPFDCAVWRDGGTPTLVLPFPAVNSASGDVAVVAVLKD
jgi:hypothetical protein